MMKLVNEYKEALGRVQECKIGDENLNRLFSMLFQRIDAIDHELEDIKEMIDDKTSELKKDFVYLR